MQKRIDTIALAPLSHVANGIAVAIQLCGISIFATVSPPYYSSHAEPSFIQVHVYSTVKPKKNLL